MLSNELSAVVKPFGLISNPRALSQAYRSLEVGPTTIRGCASYGVLEARADLPLEAPCIVDAAPFLAVVASLPDGAEVAMANEGAVLSWRCGPGKGKLATLPGVTVPPLYTDLVKNGATIAVPNDLKRALDLGAMSCGSNKLTSMGLFGVVIDKRASPAKVYSCDNTTIASCVLEGELEGWPDLITLSPDCCRLLQAIMSPQLGAVAFSDTHILYEDGDYKLRIEQLDPLTHDIAEYEKPYLSAALVVPIPVDRVMAFIKRATAMAESKRATHVDVAVTDGRLNLTFVEGSTDTDEYFLVDGLDPSLQMPPVKLDAAKLARVLLHVDELVVDHFENSVVVLRGDEGRFVYSITGIEHGK